MNCQTCLQANEIPNCYDTVTITVGYLEAAYQNTAVIVKITNVPTGKERTEAITTDGSGNVTFTAFNMMEGDYKIEVLLASTYEPLTIYSVQTDDASETSGCCVEFSTFPYSASSDFALNFKTCS